MLAPKLPMIERDRTMIPRTTPNDLVTRKPLSSKAVVVKGWVMLMRRAIDHKPRRTRSGKSITSKNGHGVSRRGGAGKLVLRQNLSGKLPVPAGGVTQRVRGWASVT